MVSAKNPSTCTIFFFRKEHYSASVFLSLLFSTSPSLPISSSFISFSFSLFHLQRDSCLLEFYFYFYFYFLPKLLLIPIHFILSVHTKSSSPESLANEGLMLGSFFHFWFSDSFMFFSCIFFTGFDSFLWNIYIYFFPPHCLCFPHSLLLE